jgi:iron complex outermembrane receptor protein
VQRTTPRFGAAIENNRGNHMTHTRKHLASAVALAILATPFGLARAQQSEEKKPQAEEIKPQPAEKKPEDERQHLGTISVTAERVTGFKARTSQVGAFRDAEIMDVPLTIQVIPRTVLDKQQAEGIYDALKNTAGVTRAQTSGIIADNLVIRGIAVDNRTSYRLNGGLPLNNLLEMPIEDKERVEALKGSSALYYGFTSPAGVVNLVMKRAGPQPVTSIAVSGNEFGSYYGHVDIGRQFSDGMLGVRFNALSGETKNAIDGFTGRRQLVSGSFDLRPTEALTVKFDFEDIQKAVVEQASVSVPAAVNGIITLPRLPDPTKLLSGTWANTSGKISNVVGRADYFFNADWAALVEWGNAHTDRERRASSQMQNVNNATGAGTLRMSLTAGQAYNNENLRTELAGHFATGFLEHDVIAGYMENKRYQNGPSQQVFNIPQNLYNPIVLAPVSLTANIILSPQNVTDKGIYALERMRIGPQWQVLLGARRTDYTNISVSGTYAVKNTSPSYAVLYRPWEHTTFYASYIEGLEEGGTAPLSTNNPGQVLPAGVTKQKEAGVRSEYFRGVQASVAYFTIDRPTAYTNAANFFVLDGRTEYKGVEYSVTGELNKEWSVFLSGMFLDAKQKNAQNTALVGKRPDNTPEQTHSLFAEYRPAFVPGLGVNAGVYYVGNRPVNSLEQGFIPAVTSYTAGANYTMRWDRQRVTFTLYVENLTDKQYWATAGGGIMSVAFPRTFKGSVKVDF